MDVDRTRPSVIFIYQKRKKKRKERKSFRCSSIAGSGHSSSTFNDIRETKLSCLWFATNHSPRKEGKEKKRHLPLEDIKAVAIPL